MKRHLLTLGLVVGAAVPALAQSSITSAGNPALAGSSVVNFSAQSVGSYSSLALAGVTISGIGGNFRVSDDFGGQYGTTGRHIDNNQGQTSGGLRFTFANPTSAFGMTWGAADTRPSSMTAYDANNIMIFTYLLPYNNPQNNNYSDYIGIDGGGASIAYADINISRFDYILIDDVRFVDQETTPEPASLVLLGTGLVGIVTVARRRNRA